MKTNSRNSHNKSGKKADLAAREIRACTVCAARFSAMADSESCPMCMLRKALPGGVESSESCSEDTACMKFTFRAFNEGTPPSRRMSWEPEERCSWF